MTREERIEEFAELLNIPQIEKLIVHKIEEVKFLFADEIALYKSVIGAFQKEAGRNMTICDDEGIEREQTYRFELNRTEDGNWLPMKIDPPIPPGRGRYDIVPPEVIKYIGKFTPDPTKIEKVKEFTAPTLNKKIFEFSFTRFSHHHAMGIISEIKKRRKRDPLKTHGETIVIPDDSFKKEPEDNKYRELFFYMGKYPKFKAHIFNEFFMKWKVLIDNNMIEADSDKN